MKKINEVHTNKISRPIKVIQFGEGNFLRAFVDFLIFRLNNETDFNGNVVVVQPIEQGLTKMLDDQNGLYTHFMKGLEDGKAKSDHNIIDVISKTVRPYEDFSEFMKLAELEEANVIISNTTEAGIAVDTTDTFDMAPPKTYPGKLTKLMYQRFLNFKGDPKMGYSVVPCELISDNGKVLKASVLEYAKLWDLGEEFIQWLLEANEFIGTLVDRIVPGFPRDKIQEIHEEIGYIDNLVVESERFLLWVLENSDLLKSRIPLDKLGPGIVFTDDITPYKLRKVRILNGLHTFMVPIGLLNGIELVKESVEDEVLGDLIHEVLQNEIIPSQDMEKSELITFGNQVIERFRNPFVKHQLVSISLNSIAKFETRVMPSLISYVNKNSELPKGLVFSMASLLSYYKGELRGRTFKPNDSAELIDYLGSKWKAVDGSKESYLKFANEILAEEVLWKSDLTLIDGLVEMLSQQLMDIQLKDYKDLLIELKEGYKSE